MFLFLLLLGVAFSTFLWVPVVFAAFEVAVGWGCFPFHETRAEVLAVISLLFSKASMVAKIEYNRLIKYIKSNTTKHWSC